jgi:hypothetical protein
LRLDNACLPRQNLKLADNMQDVGKAWEKKKKKKSGDSLKSNVDEGCGGGGGGDDNG